MKPHPLTPDEAVQIVGKRSFPDWLDAEKLKAIATQENRPRPVVRFFSDDPAPQRPKPSPAYARAMAQYDAVERWMTEHMPITDFSRAALDAALAISLAVLVAPPNGAAHRGGRPPGYDWAAVREFVFKTLDESGHWDEHPTSDWRAQADLVRAVQNYLAQHYSGLEPADSTVKARIAPMVTEWLATRSPARN